MARRTPGPLTSDVLLRDVIGSDLAIFFDQQLDSDANHMAAFTTRDPANRDAFAAHWTRILGDETITIKTILFDGHVVFFSSRRRHTRLQGDWSSDVCSSD